jgi:hypothetical protein
MTREHGFHFTDIDPKAAHLDRVDASKVFQTKPSSEIRPKSPVW